MINTDGGDSVQEEPQVTFIAFQHQAAHVRDILWCVWKEYEAGYTRTRVLTRFKSRRKKIVRCYKKLILQKYSEINLKISSPSTQNKVSSLQHYSPIHYPHEPV